MLSNMNIARLKKMTFILTAFCLLSVSVFSTDLFSVKAFSAETTAGTRGASAETGGTAASAEPADGSQEKADSSQESTPAPEDQGLTLDQVVVLSRHNIRSPLSTKGSAVNDLCAHEWFEWTSNPSELSLRGAMLETTMGQYFRLWLEKEGLFPENYIPENGAVRFYANGLQRTQATARYFSAGLLPVAVVPVECKVGYNEKDNTFLPNVYFLNDAYEKDALAEVYERGGGEKLEGLRASLDPAFRLLAEVTDMEETEAFKNGEYGNFFEDPLNFSLTQMNEPTIKGPLGTAVSLADALVLQYYEEADKKKAAFGHDLSEEDWKTIGSVLRANLDIRFGTPLLAVNESHLMLEELLSEMNAKGRKFTFLCGHDSTVASVLSALGVEAYTLPGAIEPTAPIGVKVVFERWVNKEGEGFYKVSMVYQSVDQLRSIQPLSLDTPPMIVPIHFKDAGVGENGMIPEKDLEGLFEDRIDSYYELEEIYQEEETEELDHAA